LSCLCKGATFVCCSTSPADGPWEHPPPGGLAGGAGAARSSPRPTVTGETMASMDPGTEELLSGQPSPCPATGGPSLLSGRCPVLGLVPHVWGWGCPGAPAAPLLAGCWNEPCPAHGDPSGTRAACKAVLGMNTSNGSASWDRDK